MVVAVGSAVGLEISGLLRLVVGDHEYEFPATEALPIDTAPTHLTRSGPALAVGIGLTVIV